MSFQSDIVDIVKEYYNIYDLYSDDEIIDYVRDYLDIGDVFDRSELLEYAKDEFSPEELGLNDVG